MLSHCVLPEDNVPDQAAIDAYEACLAEENSAPAPEPPQQHPNIDYNWLDYLGGLFEYVDQQQDVMAQLGVIEPEVTEIPSDERIGLQSSGVHIVVPIDEIPDGINFVGATGMGPCIGVIVTDGDTIFVFHFDGTDDPTDTLEQVLVNLGDGANAAIFGGDGSLESEQTLEDVMDYFDDHPEITIDGYVNHSGLWVDAEGNYYITPDLANETDDNQPPPPPPNPYGGGKPAVCFVAGTLVQSPDGPRPIESISPGDVVLTYDLLLRRMITTRVVTVEVHDGDFEVLELNVHNAETLGVTRGHPFLTRRGWVWSEHLNRYGEVCKGHGEFTKVTIGADRSHNSSTVYNVRTEQGTYLVGSSGLVVSGRSMYDRVEAQSRAGLTSGTVRSASQRELFGTNDESVLEVVV